MHCAIFLAGPQYARDAGDWELAKGFAQPCCKCAIVVLRIRHGDNHSPIGICRLKAIDAKEVDLHILKGDDSVGVWSNLPVGPLEPECLIECDRLVEVGA